MRFSLAIGLLSAFTLVGCQHTMQSAETRTQAAPAQQTASTQAPRRAPTQQTTSAPRRAPAATIPAPTTQPATAPILDYEPELGGGGGGW
ncbi:hypothetical protein [Pararhodobacter sp. SW119]|uniref:hypothetical protein n=1 Tax=Pararhodobacter sp. SW119 TaxID=2780075 RepID=UPI001ADEFF36|nr:hypothetical protein [Pararhodobacter sp. SW119]